MKESNRSRRIKRVVPLESFNLIIEFEDGSLRQFPNTRVADTALWFLAFPLKLRTVDVFPSGLHWGAVSRTQLWDGQNLWEQQASLDVATLMEWSDPVQIETLSQAVLNVAMRNQAPTDQDPRHHVYVVGIRPFADQDWVILGESIGGGHAERGGSVALAVDRLDSFKGWREHCALAGCGWIVPMLEDNNVTDSQRKVGIVERYRQLLTG